MKEIKLTIEKTGKKYILINWMVEEKPRLLLTFVLQYSESRKAYF